MARAAAGTWRGEPKGGVDHGLTIRPSLRLVNAVYVSRVTLNGQVRPDL
jgi:hypothetical protein